MSLRTRVIGLVAAALAISLALGGTVILLNAARSVRTEMRSALLVAHQSVDNAVREMNESSNPRRDLDDLVASFKGNRHLRVWLSDTTGVPEVFPPDERSPFGKVPKWFVRLLGVTSDIQRVPVNIHGRPAGVLVIETDPRNEASEVWDELSASLVVLALFCGQVVALIYLFIGRALRPLARLTSAMEQVGKGGYGVVHVAGRLTPELALLRDGFNRMAARVAAADADNHRLNQNLLTLQEEERNEIAGDLHDEIGPFLFAINVDVANATRLVDENRFNELAEQLRSIAESARHLQQRVRLLLRRLRPIALAEFGLAEALDSLVEFWRRRYPDIDFRTGVSPHCGNLGRLADLLIYRTVQECLSNAVRHGEPEMITIAVDQDARNGYDGEVTLEVADDGRGTEGTTEPGYGLIGMEERIRAIGGRLIFSN